MKASAIGLLTAQIESFQAMHAIKDWNASSVLPKKADMTDCHHESFICDSD